MSYIKIEKDKLVNLEYALNRELIRSNRAGSYASTTLNGCNTRKYHGLLVSPIKNGNKHVLLSTLDETIVQRGKEFRLSIHQYPDNVFFPHGHRYLAAFETEPIPAKTYRVGGVILKKELLLVQEEERILIKYTIEDAHSPTILRLQPLLAFRHIHELSRENMSVNIKTTEVQNGIKYRMYNTYPFLYMQTSKNVKFITAPDWNKNIMYQEEQKRGYEYTEDLFTIGFFDINVKKGDEIIFSAGLTEAKTRGLNKKFNSEVNKRTPRTNFENNLLNSAQQFIIKEKKDNCIIAGFHWYSAKMRESLIALPGLTLYNNDTDTFTRIFDSLLKKFLYDKKEYSPDIPLLIIRTLQEYISFADDCESVWKKYGKKILLIFRNVKDGKYKAVLHDNGLLYIPEEYPVSTWMNEYSDGKPVTPRTGFVVEINALWYNTLQFLSGISDLNNSKTLKNEISNLPQKAKHFFNIIFINEQAEYLYDFVNNSEQNDDIRPNQIFAASLPYSPLSDKTKKDVLKKVEKHLLTAKGLRTLSPKNVKYKGKYKGCENTRNNARHQGTVHPWLIGEYCNAWMNLYHREGIDYVEKIYKQFENEMNEHGLGTISELYDGNPPHKPNGAISYAPSISALLRIKMLTDKCKLNG
ncbi:MAG: glycogen debranching enzyme N-terminal domain-containing protein [Bacteroidales bacterium]|nr:glycogen debranching enzyme N-terminal domain-containing protein [Bacteroidales bacterium]